MRAQFIWAFFSLTGRIGPAACLLGGLFLIVIQMFLFYQVMRLDPQSPAAAFWETLFTGAVIVSVWCNFALTAKRFHDFGKPTVFAAISIVAGLILYIVLFFIKGDPGPNRFGPAAGEPR